jgi:hypothetical protein
MIEWSGTGCIDTLNSGFNLRRFSWLVVKPLTDPYLILSV